MLLWADGTSWLTSVGYWPYADPSRSQAEAWDGADAPHLTDEAPTSQRTTQLLAHGSDGRIAAVDLERTGPGDYRARRQVVHVSPDVWVVLDVVDRAGSTGTRTVWTLSPDVELRATDVPGSYELKSRTGRESARIDYFGSPETAFADYRGSLAPFAGWHVVSGTPQPAPAVVVEQPAGDAWLAAVVSRTGGVSATGPVVSRPQVTEITSADEWAMTVPTASGQLEVRRSGGSIVTTRSDRAGASHETLDLAPGPDIRSEQAGVRAAFDSLAREYPTYRSLSARRTTVSIVILLLLLCQEVVFLFVGRRHPSAYMPLRVVSLACWVATAVWLNSFFLQPWEILTLGMGAFPLLGNVSLDELAGPRASGPGHRAPGIGPRASGPGHRAPGIGPSVSGTSRSRT
jgi:hypothetical protein